MPRFHHERLVVYRRAVEFFSFAHELVASLPSIRADLRDQLIRASMSMPLNIAEGSGEFRANETARFYWIARRSATECAAILDVIETVGGVEAARLDRGRMLLDEVVAMLTKMAMPGMRKEG